ncbi:hypothetical protein JOC95_003518 [Bacillus tianshenii]|uniref:Uncharacterized protein n=1 Tax=Sutcliffiella tianshenii TaxID=1463404 RepID=A0ABS2P3U8_9BACI|nr:hypothetical protein [Bacillus tianshenii]MBM7621629.1 hypothetical protein [Bacillus tianshenii]
MQRRRGTGIDPKQALICPNDAVNDPKVEVIDPKPILIDRLYIHFQKDRRFASAPQTSKSKKNTGVQLFTLHSGPLSYVYIRNSTHHINPFRIA